MTQKAADVVSAPGYIDVGTIASEPNNVVRMGHARRKYSLPSANSDKKVHAAVSRVVVVLSPLPAREPEWPENDLLIFRHRSTSS